MVKEYLVGIQDKFITDNLKWVLDKVKEFGKEIINIIREIGKKENLISLEFLNIIQVDNIQVNGIMDWNMDLEYKHSQIKICMLVILNLENLGDLENL